MKLKSPISNGALRLATLLLMVAAATTGATPQTYTPLHSFDGTDGGNPYAGLVQGTDGDLYSTTVSYGISLNGTVFKITTSGTLTTLHMFCPQSGCLDGLYPYAGLVQGPDGNFYGSTESGGANFAGTIFKITASGTLTTLYSFCSQSGCPDGYYLVAGLIQGTDGNFYGTTQFGGANGYGTVFKITPSGTLTTLYSFCSQANCTDGAEPYAQLVLATDGDFYGTTKVDGANSGYGTSGTVFKITPSGTLTTLYSFCSQSHCADGALPSGQLVEATDGNFYGTTEEGGANEAECSGYGCGTVFKITPSGTLTTLYSFCTQRSCLDGEFPEAGLVQATDGNLYGTTVGGGTSNCDVGCGTIFRITPSGTLTTLYSFCPQGSCRAGANPYAALVQATDGNFYGTTFEGGLPDGGSGGYGTVFRLSVDLGSFVETQAPSGRVGNSVRSVPRILTDATSVSFNGTAAVFTVMSSSFIKATVPEGATSGFVTVTTPSGTLTSNKRFLIEP